MMPTSGVLSINLLDDTPVRVNETSGDTGAANFLVTPSGNSRTVIGSAYRSHETTKVLGPFGSVGPAENSVLTQSASSVTAVAFGSSADLLGDEISEVPAACGTKRGHSVLANAAGDPLREPSREAASAPSEKSSGHTHDQPSESQTSAAALQLQQDRDAAALCACDGGSPQQQGKDPQQELSKANGADDLPQAAVAQPAQQRLASPDAKSPVVSHQAVKPNERPLVPSADGSLEGTATNHANGEGSQSLPSEADNEGQSADGSSSGEASEGPSGQGGDGDDERIVDSDREVVEEEDAFGDFADFTSASHFLPGGGGGNSMGAVAFGAPPPSASTVVMARGAGSSSTSSPSTHRHAHLGGLVRPLHGMMGAAAAAVGHHAGAAGSASVSGAVSEHGSLAGEFSDFSHQSPPPSVAPSRGGGGRKSVASIASVGSRAGGDDDLGDYNSVVGSSVWRAPSQMATSSYAAAAGADDDFGDFTSDITSTSDFAPSTQPPSAVAVSGPGSVHPDDDFGSFASHRSTADDDEDDFGNFNAAPSAGSGAALGTATGAAAGTGAGPSGSGAAVAGGAGGPTVGAGGPAAAIAVCNAGTPSCGAAAAFSPRDVGAAAGAVSGSHAYHSTQSIGPFSGGSTAALEVAAATEGGLLQLPPGELRQAVARALQPLLPAGTPTSGMPQLPEDQVMSAAWAQLRRHMQGNVTEGGGGSGSVIMHNGVPLPPLGSIMPLADVVGAQEGGGVGRNGFTAAVKFVRPLRWKGSESERRLLSGLGLSELAAHVRMVEAAEVSRTSARGRSDSASGLGGGLCQAGALASFGDAPPRRTRVDLSTTSAGLYRDTECDSAAVPSGGAVGGSGSRSRGLDQNGETHGPLPEHVGGTPSGATPRPASIANSLAGGQQRQQPLGGSGEK